MQARVSLYGGLSEAVNFRLSSPFESSKETGKVQIDKIHPFAMENRISPAGEDTVTRGFTRPRRTAGDLHVRSLTAILG